MTIEVDMTIEEVIAGKKIVLYTPNMNGEMPNASIKQFVPSGVIMGGLDGWFVGYTPVIIDGYNMIEITEEIACGLQYFTIEDGITKKYNAVGSLNPDGEKLLITLTDEQKTQQLVSKKYAMVVALNKKLDRKLTSYFNQFSVVEKSTWDIQLAEAKAYTVDNTASTPILSAIATERGLTVGDLAAKVLIKAASYQEMVAKLIGEKQALETRIQTASTNAELNDLRLVLADY